MAYDWKMVSIQRRAVSYKNDMQSKSQMPFSSLRPMSKLLQLSVHTLLEAAETVCPEQFLQEYGRLWAIEKSFALYQSC